MVIWQVWLFIVILSMENEMMIHNHNLCAWNAIKGKKHFDIKRAQKKSFQFSRSLSTFLIYSVSGAYIVIMWMIEKRRILYPHNFFPRLVHINFSLPFHFLCHFLLIPSKLIFFFLFSLSRWVYRFLCVYAILGRV